MSSETDVSGRSETDFEHLQATPEFARLRRALRRFVFPMTVAFLAWYLLYVLLTAYARDFVSTKVFGSVNVGFLLGWGQFVTTFGIAILYSRYADRKLDPQAEQIREEAGEHR
nr:DUF485 domain-containing protein [Nakamurella alba]